MKQIYKYFTLLAIVLTIGVGNVLGAVTPLSLPKAWGATEGKAAYTDDLGCTQNGLGGDYSNSGTYLKFDGTGDYLIIQLADAPLKLTYNIKSNSFSGGTFKVQQSADGSSYTDVVSYTSISDGSKEHDLASTTRYIKFIYTTKSTGNVGLGTIGISKYVAYTVKWYINGEETTEGSPTNSVLAGGKVSKLPTAPTSSDCDGSKVFVGWSDRTITGTTDTKPSVLFSTADNSPAITGNTNFYAVFATAGEADVTTTFNFDGATLGTGGYKDTDFEWQGITFKRSQMYYNNSGAQVKGGSSNGFWNTDAFPGAIKEIKVTTTQNNATLYTGASAKATTASNSITTGGERTFSISTANNYRYFYIKPGSSYIVITTLKVKYVGTSYSAYATTCCKALNDFNGAVTWNSPTEAVLKWDNIAHSDSTWYIYYKTHAAGSWTSLWVDGSSDPDSKTAGTDSEITVISDGGTNNKLKVIISGLACGTDYDFKIVADPADGYCNKSETIEDDTEHKYQITLTGSGTVQGGTYTVNSTAAATVTSCNGTNNVSIAATASTGYDFTSWSVSKNAGGSVTPASSTSASTTFSMPAEDVTVNATFSAQTYDITYKDEGGSAYSGSNESSLPATHTYDAATALDDGEKDGYSFLGWYTDEDCTVGPITSVGATAYTADFTLYAKWAADGTKRVTISAPTHGSISVTYTGMESALTSGYRDIDENTVLTITATPSTGYQLSSLKIDDDAFTSGSTHTLTADITISATFTTITYTISYENMTGATNHKDNPATYTIEDDDITLGDASKTGYTFDGWFTDNGVWSDEVEEIEGGSYGNVTLYAKWTVIAYTLAWSSNGGDDLTGDYTKGSTDYGTTLTPPNTPTRTGYTFAKWNTATDGSGDDYTGTMPAANTTYYAQWNINSYNTSVTANENVTITATPSGGSAIAEEDDADVEYNKTVTLNYSSLTSGLTWGGWRVYKSDDASTTVTVSGTGNGATFSMPAYDVVVVAYTYGDVVAWCDPQISITGGSYLTSTKDIYVHATSTTSNLLSISSSDLGDATSIDFKYLDADNSDAEVAKASSLFRLCNDGSSNYNVADGTMSINVSASNECNLTYSIKYTPTAYNTINHYKLQLTIKKGSNVLKTMNYDLYGRSLPEEFVLAIKSPKDSKWYALPNNILNASTLVSTTTMGSNIIVDNNTTPTKAMVAADTTAYKASGRFAATSNMYGVRFQSCIEVDSKYPYLQVMGSSGTNYVKTSNTGSSTLQDLYLKSEDFGAYTITVPSSGAGDKRFGINKGGNMGYFASNTDQLSSDVYLLPIGVKSKLINATVNEWGRHDALVVADISDIEATQVDGKLGETESDDLFALGDAVATNTYFVRLSDDIDLSGKSGESLTLRWYNDDDQMVGASAVVIPSIIGTGSEDNWSELANTPTLEDIVVVEGDITVDEAAQAKRVIIDQLSGSGKLTIDAGKALVVEETVRKLGSTNFGATEVDDLEFGSTLLAGTGALVMGEHDGTNQATVQFATKAYKNGEYYVNQYIGTPFNDETNILYNYYNSWIYAITYQDGVPGWNDRVDKGEGLNPFEGYDLMRPETTQNVVLSMEGTLVSSDDVTLTSSSSPVKLTYNGSSNTENVLANSWMAPIKIKAFETSDFTNMAATIYIFNAGSTEDAKTTGEGTAGNYSTYPINDAEATDVIPSMQSFSVYATAASPSLKLDYSKLVYDPAVAGLAVQPNFAPRRAKAEAMTSLKLHVAGESGFADELKVYVHDDFDEGFENGWDGHKMYGLDEAPQLYAVTQDGNMAVNCVPDAESMLIGLKAGTEDQLYTMTFEYDDAEPLYMVDTKTNTYTQVMTGNAYTFQTNDVAAHNRFILTHYAPQMPTDLEPTSDSSLKGRERGLKFIEGEKMFILVNGVLYDATGRRVEGVRE